MAYGLVHAVARTLLGGQLVVGDGSRGVIAAQVQVADGVVNLVEIVLVTVVTRHVAQRAHLALDVVAVVHGTLLDAGVKLGAVTRTVAAAGFLKGAIGHLLVARLLVELAQEELQTHLLGALGGLHGLAKVRHRLGILLLLDVVVGKGQVGQAADALVLDVLGVNVCQHVVGLGGPSHGAVTQRFPHLGLLHQGGLPLEVARDVTERGSGIQEVAFHIFRLGQQVPAVVHEGVVLLALHPLAVLLVVVLAAFLLGLALDRVQRDGLLHLLDGAVKRAAGLGRLGVAQCLGRMDKHVLRVVVLVVLLHGFDLLVVVGLAMVVHVVACVHGLPESATGGVFLRAAGMQHDDQRHQQ